MKDSLDYVVEKYRADLALPETEEYWERIAKALLNIKTCCDNGNFVDTNEVVQTVKTFYQVIKQSLLSERTRLSSAALDLVHSVAAACGTDFTALISLLIPTLMILTGRTNKVVITRTKNCLITIIECCPSPALLPHFMSQLGEKSVTMRQISAECCLAYIKCCNPPDIEKETRAQDVETIIRKTARDASADIRKISREIFGAYQILLPQRVDSFTAPLTPTIRKYLDIKASAAPGPSKPTLTRVKSMGAIAATQKDKRPEVKHTRTVSVKAPERVPRPPSAEPTSRPQSAAATRPEPVRPTMPSRAPASRPEPSRQASSAASSGPARVLVSASVEPTRLASGRTRVAPSAPAQRGPARPVAPSSSTTGPMPRAGLPSSSSSGAVRSGSGPRRVPIPSPDPVDSKNQPTRPSSQQSKHEETRPSSQLGRPSRVAAQPTVAKVPPSRAMPPPTTRADGTALGSNPVAKPTKPVASSSSSIAATSAAAEPVKRSRPVGGLHQPTASQLAKIRPLVVQKVAKKPGSGFAPTKGGAKAGGSNAKSSGGRLKDRAPAETVEALPVHIPLPPSPEPDAANVPLPPPVAEEEKELLEDNAVGQVELDRPLVDFAADSKPASHLPPIAPNAFVTGPDGHREDLPSTPAQLHLPPSEWALQNAKTPISALLSSIQQGFEFSPASPLSPPHTYLNGETTPLPLLL